MATIIEDLQRIIAETNQASVYWEDFKELYVEKVQWNLEGRRLVVETTSDFAMREDMAYWEIWQLTKTIMIIFPEIQKLKFKVPTYQRIRKKRTFGKKKIWLIYEITPLAYEHFLHELRVKKKITDEKELARLFGRYFAANRSRRAA